MAGLLRFMAPRTFEFCENMRKPNMLQGFRLATIPVRQAGMNETIPPRDANTRPSTLDDVARRAGVSLGTASKALNGRDRVSDATRARVEDAARALAYVGNPLARGLSQGLSGTVGLLTSDLEGRFSLPILMGAEDRFGAGRVSVFSATHGAMRSANNTTFPRFSPAASMPLWWWAARLTIAPLLAATCPCRSSMSIRPPRTRATSR